MKYFIVKWPQGYIDGYVLLCTKILKIKKNSKRITPVFLIIEGVKLMGFNVRDG